MASKELNFAPSKGLSVITGLLEGLSERKDAMEAKEAAEAKNQNAMMRIVLPQLYQQLRHQQTEIRETKEFAAEQGLAERKFDYEKESAGLDRLFEVKMQEMRNTFSNLDREDQQKFDIVMEGFKNDVKLQLKAMDQRYSTLTREDEQREADFQRRQGELYSTSSREDTQREADMQRRESQVYKTKTRKEEETYQTSERVAGERVDAEQNNLDRELKREISGTLFSKEEQPAIEAYKVAIAKLDRSMLLMQNKANRKNSVLNEQIATEADEAARYGYAVREIYRAKGLPDPYIPMKVQQFDTGGILGFKTNFSFVPREEEGATDTEDVPITPENTERNVPVPTKTSVSKAESNSDVAVAIAKLRKFGTTVSPDKIRGLERANFSDEEIEEIIAGVSGKKVRPELRMVSPIRRASK